MRRKGFTLVELLVVIGVIALLISILMPALQRAKEQANWVSCLSNMRQLGQAFTMYQNAHKGRFPRPGVNQEQEDWIHWERSRDINNSALAQYIGRPVNPAVFRCASDDYMIRRSNPGNPYNYSYSANYLILRLNWNGQYEPGRVSPPMRITEIVNPSDKIVLIDESMDTADDGCWAWQQSFGSGQNIISNRHNRRKEDRANPDAGYGNVVFADGHADRIERRKSFDQRFYDPKYKN